MIKSITIGNFRSIKDPINFDFSKSNRKKNQLSNYISVANLELASSTVVYGANASGKSNLLSAFSALRSLILYSARLNPDDVLEPYEPFKLSKGYENKPSHFQIEFLVEAILYNYTVDFSERIIEQEKLIYYPSGREALLFERIAGNEIIFRDYFKGAKKTIEKLTLPNQLFLSKAAENNAKSILPVFQFFKNRLQSYSFLSQHTESGLEHFYAKRLADKSSSAFSKKLNALICSLDTGIQSIRVKKIDWNKMNLSDNLKKEIPGDFNYEITTVHHLFDDNEQSAGSIAFDIDEESTGTRSLLSLGGVIIDALEKGAALIIDEFEKNLHPIITSYLIKLFSEPLLNPKNAQLIFATHDVTQLNDELFNRDQVWFTQKNEFGITELTRCSDIKGLRLNAPLDKWYISGRLGGTAIINDTDFIIAMQEEDAE